MFGFEVAQSTVPKHMVQGGPRTCGKFFLVINQVRTHWALGKDTPLGLAVQRSGVIVAIPILSGLHHHYVRI
jgi:hypothetical protein